MEKESGHKGALVLTEPEAATLLKMTTRMLGERRRAGKIRAIQDGRFIGYTVAQLESYLTACSDKKIKLDELTKEDLIAALRKRIRRKARRRQKPRKSTSSKE